MDRVELISQLNEILAQEFEVDIATITPEANVKETLMLNSLAVVDMIAIIEFKFGVKIPATELSDIQTFEALYDYVFQNIKKIIINN